MAGIVRGAVSGLWDVAGMWQLRLTSRTSFFPFILYRITLPVNTDQGFSMSVNINQGFSMFWRTSTWTFCEPGSWPSHQCTSICLLRHKETLGYTWLISDVLSEMKTILSLYIDLWKDSNSGPTWGQLKDLTTGPYKRSKNKMNHFAHIDEWALTLIKKITKYNNVRTVYN